MKRTKYAIPGLLALLVAGCAQQPPQNPAITETAPGLSPVYGQPAAASAPVPQAPVVAAPPRRVVTRAPVDEYVEESPRTARVTKGRSKKKSAAIIGGSAGVGAAIGALAGGGKGAAIGALAGGAGGLVYDRTTANKKKRRIEQ